jgi:CRP/FNR family transcriptional regulator, cyclic AMP receptor protein
MDKARIALLQGTPLFGGVREYAIEFLLSLARVVSLRQGDFYFRENDPAESMFVLESGRVAIVKRWMDCDYTLCEWTQGDCFGEMALMEMSTRSASVRALEDCTALELPASSLFQLYERDCEQFAIIQMNMGREVCRRLRDANERLFEAARGGPQVLPGHIIRSS